MSDEKTAGAPAAVERPTIRVRLDEGEPRVVPTGIRVEEILEERRSPGGLDYMGALVNNDVVSLSFSLEVDSRVVPITVENHHGDRIYRRSIAFLLAKVMHEMFPAATYGVEHSLGTGLYCTFEQDGRSGISPEDLDRVDRRMHELVDQDLPIVRSKVSFETALRRFEEEQQRDKYNLLRFRNPPVIVTYECGGFSDLAHGVMAARTGLLTMFKLIPYPPGFVIQFPNQDNPLEIPALEEQPQLFRIFQEHKEWGRILGLRTVGRLNELIANGEIRQFMMISEALHEKKIARIADEVFDHRGRIKVICIAGPSSAGKTTMAKRLMVQLRVNGLRPATISVDDYFVDRDNTPRDEQGNFDFEHVEAIDLKFFNQHVDLLASGKEIEVPYFNFESGKREFRGKTMKLNEDQILILEGIHCLNPRLTESLEAGHVFKIYVSALGQLNLDRHNRISTTDSRLLRRLVRDHKFRGHSALTTLQMWPSVRRGEKKWIFPNQRNADIAFNSALEYELAVLKPMAEPLLAEVKPFEPEYANARRLMEFLSYFLSAPEDPVPAASILREYIGNSSFRY